jgi:hypothetical protein
MSPLDRFESEALDRHITGNGGEDQYPDVEPPEFSDQDLLMICEALWAHANKLREAGSDIAYYQFRSVDGKIRAYLKKIGELD